MGQPLVTGRRCRGDGGFTLIELLTVIAIIAILSAIAVFSFRGIRGKSSEAACRSDYKSIELAMEAYYTKSGSYPTLAQLKDGSTTILKAFPTSTGYAFTTSGSTITVSGSTVVGGVGLTGCNKKP